MNPALAEESLSARFTALKKAEPKLRIRDCASRLGATEAELVAAQCGGEGIRLDVADWTDFTRELKELGRVMVLTRNEHCVHERKGCYESITAHGKAIGLVTGKDIDLRFFYRTWAYAFAVTVPGNGHGLMRSFQIFDGYGEAVHKVYPQEEARLPEFMAIIERHRHANQAESLVIEDKPVKEALVPVDDARRQALLEGWAVLKDTHDFFPLLGRNEVTRLQAMEIADGRFTRRLSTDAPRRLLEQARDQAIDIMVFVGNDACIQIHTGPVKKLVEFGEWFNVLDPDFNLHLKETGVASAWHVVKPTADGDVNSVELYDADGGIVAQFFGARKPGIPEREDWRALAQAL